MEESNKVLKEYLWPLKAFLDIDVHRTFYKNIQENEEITLSCKSKDKMEIITSKGYTFAVFSNYPSFSPFPIYEIFYKCCGFSSKSESKFDYFYYSLENGAVFKGYICDIEENGAFNVRVFQYASNDYIDPKKKEYTKAFVNPGLGKTYYQSSMRYEQEVEEEKRTGRLTGLLVIAAFLFIIILGSISPACFWAALLITVIAFVIRASWQSPQYENDANLHQQINELMRKEGEREEQTRRAHQALKRLQEEKIREDEKTRYSIRF